MNLVLLFILDEKNFLIVPLIMEKSKPKMQLEECETKY